MCSKSLILLIQKLTRLHIRGETIRINARLRIVFERIAIYCHIAIFDGILVKRHFIWDMGFGSKEKNIHPV